MSACRCESTATCSPFIFFSRARIFFQKSLCRYNKTGSAIAALHGALVELRRVERERDAQEIAAAMLRRQQAGAIIAARQKIGEGAVGMVDMALDLLAQSGKVQLDEEPEFLFPNAGATGFYRVFRYDR